MTLSQEWHVIQSGFVTFIFTLILNSIQILFQSTEYIFSNDDFLFQRNSHEWDFETAAWQISSPKLTV